MSKQQKSEIPKTSHEGMFAGIEQNSKNDTTIKSTPKSLKDSAYNHLENLIVTGELEPGRWVSETELTTISGYSRAPVRSAIERLAEQQLIAVYPRRGAQVCPIDFTQQFRALELRRAVEQLLVSAAAKRASAAQKEKFAALSNAFSSVAKSRNQTEMTQIDSDTFTLILTVADNAFAAKALISVKGLSRRFWILYQEQHGDTSTMANAFAEVTAAIGNGDPTEAALANNRLIDYVEKFTMNVVGYSAD